MKSNQILIVGSLLLANLCQGSSLDDSCEDDSGEHEIASQAQVNRPVFPISVDSTSEDSVPVAATVTKYVSFRDGDLIEEREPSHLESPRIECLDGNRVMKQTTYKTFNAEDLAVDTPEASHRVELHELTWSQRLRLWYWRTRQDVEIYRLWIYAGSIYAEKRLLKERHPSREAQAAIVHDEQSAIIAQAIAKPDDYERVEILVDGERGSADSAEDGVSPRHLVVNEEAGDGEVAIEPRTVQAYANLNEPGFLNLGPKQVRFRDRLSRALRRDE